MKNSNILIMSVTLMDFITALLILLDPGPLYVARMGIFYELFPISSIGALLMLLAVLCALFALTLEHRSIKRFILLLPQQFFLLLTTGSAVDYVIMQHYADGVIRSWQFILQDQLPSIILTIGYALASIDLHKRKQHGR